MNKISGAFMSRLQKKFNQELNKENPFFVTVKSDCEYSEDFKIFLDKNNDFSYARGTLIVDKRKYYVYSNLTSNGDLIDSSILIKEDELTSPIRWTEHNRVLLEKIKELLCGVVDVAMSSEERKRLLNPSLWKKKEKKAIPESYNQDMLDELEEQSKKPKTKPSNVFSEVMKAISEVIKKIEKISTATFEKYIRDLKQKNQLKTTELTKIEAALIPVVEQCKKSLSEAGAQLVKLDKLLLKSEDKLLLQSRTNLVTAIDALKSKKTKVEADFSAIKHEIEQPVQESRVSVSEVSIFSAMPQASTSSVRPSVNVLISTASASRFFASETKSWSNNPYQKTEATDDFWDNTKRFGVSK